MSSVLVLGGYGTVGVAAAERLATSGHAVVVAGRTRLQPARQQPRCAMRARCVSTPPTPHSSGRFRFPGTRIPVPTASDIIGIAPKDG